MIDVAGELSHILELATALNNTPGVDRRGGHGAWYEARDHIARSLARSVGTIRKSLGITAEPQRSFCSRHVDLGLDAVRQGGRIVPIERRPR